MTILHSINHEQRLYVMKQSYGYSCYGFDVLDRKGKALTDELSWRGEAVDPWPAEKGTEAIFYHWEKLLEIMREHNRRTGYRFKYELTPQLTGLENCRVEVVTLYDETRRFWVGKSAGVAPCHLEITRRNSTGGGAAEHEYKSVRIVERGR